MVIVSQSGKVTIVRAMATVAMHGSLLIQASRWEDTRAVYGEGHEAGSWSSTTTASMTILHDRPITFVL